MFLPLSSLALCDVSRSGRFHRRPALCLRANNDACEPCSTLQRTPTALGAFGWEPLVSPSRTSLSHVVWRARCGATVIAVAPSWTKTTWTQMTSCPRFCHSYPLRSPVRCLDPPHPCHPHNGFVVWGPPPGRPGHCCRCRRRRRLLHRRPPPMGGVTPMAAPLVGHPDGRLLENEKRRRSPSPTRCVAPIASMSGESFPPAKKDHFC